MAATEAAKLAAVQKGLAYLYTTQQPGGYWSFSGHEQAATGAAVFAFLNQQDKWGNNAALYQATVDKAIAYLVSTANTLDVSTRNDGVNVCPGGSGSCKGVYWHGNGESIYTTGLVAPAIAAYGLKVGGNLVATTSGPLAGMTWSQIAQGITNAFAASQSTNRNGDREGGWRNFTPGNGDSDSAATQWAVISFLYNETLRAVTPEVVKNGLKVWLSNVQNPSGAVCFQPGTEPCDQADTGGWLLAMKFAGYDLTNAQLQAALSFLNTSWQSTANNVSYGNFGHPYAMWTVYKGLETTIGLNDTTHIVNLLTDCGASTGELPGNPSGGVACSWSEDYNHWLIKNQNTDGSWTGYSYWTGPVAAAFYVNILGGARIPGMTSGGTPERTESTPKIQHPTALATGRQTISAVASTDSAQADQPAANSTRPRPYVRKGVTALAVKGDGTALASASTDNRVRVWSATTGLQTLIFPASAGLPTGLAFSPDDGTLSSVGRDSVVRVWNAVSGSEAARLNGHEHAIRALAASPDGKFLASAGEESRVMLWDLTNRKLSKILYGPTDFVNAISFSPDSRLLAIGGEDARVLIFDVASGKSLFTLRGHSGPVDTVAFSPDGTVLASGGQDTVIHLWDVVKGQQRQALRGHSAPIRTIAFSPDGQSIASSGEDTLIILWNAATGALDKTLFGSTGVINVVAFGPRGRFLGSASETGQITLWSVTTGLKLLSITVPTAP